MTMLCRDEESDGAASGSPAAVVKSSANPSM